MKLTAHWPNDLEMPKVVHNVQFTMTNVQSVLLIGQPVVEFIEVFRSMTNCRICRRIHLFPPNLGGSARILDGVQPISSVRHMAQLN